VEVAAGQIINCARRSDGSVWCWGDVIKGAPSKIQGGPFSFIATGSETLCGVLEGGGVACAGAPFLTGAACTELAVSWNPLATPIALLKDVASVSVGQRHACAIDSSGVTSCWGCAGLPWPEGYWSLGSMAQNTLDPILVPGVASSVRIASQTESTCALQSDGNTICWGDLSQFGPGITAQPIGPTAAGFPNAPIDVSVGVTFSCAAYENEALCLGGIPTFEDGCQDRRDTPVSFSVPGIREISVGYEQACVRDENDAVWCWGCNTAGEVGDGTTMPRGAPVKVL
jgi:alpha-tubulin suppressor-like RCC1 family protein